MKPSSHRTASRIRKLIRRKGWTLIKVAAVDTVPNWLGVENLDNTLNYHVMRKWCEEQFVDGSWFSSLHSYSGTTERGLRRFVFENESDAVLFSLRWL